jgi:hypothetical protein
MEPANNHYSKLQKIYLIHFGIEPKGSFVIANRQLTKVDALGVIFNLKQIDREQTPPYAWSPTMYIASTINN